MSLESTVLCLDNSEWMRDGDYSPSRLDTQQDAATLIANDRTRNNPENTVGVLSMAGKSVKLHTSPTEEVGKILAALARVEICGKSEFTTGIQVAQLALKHRKNKNGGQRIIVFVGSPIFDDVASFQRIGKQLKKNNVAVDIIQFGDYDGNTEKLSEFQKAVNSGDNSHLITIPAGVSPLDALAASPVLQSAFSFSQAQEGGNGGFDEYGGIDPSMDPELALAIRVSTEEARAQEEARNLLAQQESSQGLPAAAPSSFSNSNTNEVSEEDLDEEALLQRALELSMLDSTTTHSSAEPKVNVSEASAAPTSATETTLMDPNFVNQLLQSVDADMNDPLIQAAINQLGMSAAPEKKNPGDDTDKSDSKKRKNDES